MKLLSKIGLVFFFFNFSCSRIQNKDTKKDEVDVIDLSNSFSNYEKKHLSEIADSIYYISLETDSNSLLDKIKNPLENVQFTSNRIFISDGKQLIAYDLRGKLRGKIGRRGQGPNEFVYINDFTVLEEKKLIIIKSDAQQKLLFFTFDNEFIHSVSINWYPSNISNLHSKYIILSNLKGQRKILDYYTFTIIDQTGNIENHLLKQNWEEKIEKNDEIGLSNIASFYFLGDTLSYWEFQYDTIYRIFDSNKILPKYYVDLGKDKLPREMLLTSKLKESKRKINNYDILYGFIETQKYIFFKISNKNKLTHILYDKITKSAKNIRHGNTIDKFSFENDIDGGLPFWPDGIAGKDRAFSLFYGIELLKKIKDNEVIQNYYSEKKMLREIVRDSKLMDNPILMIVKLKDK